MEKDIVVVALRQRAVYLPTACCAPQPEVSGPVLALVNQLRQLGYAVSQPLLAALCGLDADGRQTLLDALNDVLGTTLNWAALVRGWQTPTGESAADHFVTLVVNSMLRQQPHMPAPPGTTLPCGHFIPDGTFPLSRYTGCPFCGTPFNTAAGEVYTSQGADKLKLLSLWTDSDLQAHYEALLGATVPLNATQADSLQKLLAHRPLPAGVAIGMKETRLIVADALVKQGRYDEAAALLPLPADVLRFLWYRHTGHLQLLRPATIVRQNLKNMSTMRPTGQEQAAAASMGQTVRRRLRLKYSRAEGRRVARWLNGQSAPVDDQLASMHPQREMWVRFVRALRLAEHARRKGFGRLQTLLDRFYRADYRVWQAGVEASRLAGDADATLALLCQRPGLFARSLFSTMLWFGPDRVTKAFAEVAPQVPPRLLVSLGSAAHFYFDRQAERVVRPLTGVLKTIGPHPLIDHYTDDELAHAKALVSALYLDAMRHHFAAQPTKARTIFIDPQLFSIPVAVADRTSTIQDASCALQGQRFSVSGDAVRLFLQWGRDLPAQHLDMDLSAFLLSDTEAEACAYFNLSPEGARHSGDIRNIPDRVGTAEYVELSLPVLQQRGIRRVVFTCNAYSQGALSPNLQVGWMSATWPMSVSDETGVAYDPSTVDHIVRISEGNLSKGLVFGVLDVAAREITWLEVPFDGQTVLVVEPATISAFLRRLALKPTIGQLLRIKAEAQHLAEVADAALADEAYSLVWAQDSAAVSRLLL